MRLRAARLIAIATLTSTSPMALAQQPPQSTVSAGMQIVDTQGSEVGTVVAVSGETLTVKTDRHEAQLPKTAFTQSNGKLLFSMTREELNEAVERSLAEANASLVRGATVTGSKGTPVGTIDAIDEQYATLKLLSGKLIKIPRSSLGGGPQGGIIGLTAEELEAKVSGAP